MSPLSVREITGKLWIFPAKANRQFTWRVSFIAIGIEPAMFPRETILEMLAMKSEMELVITDADLERMQAEVDEAMRVMEEEQIDAIVEIPERHKSA